MDNNLNIKAVHICRTCMDEITNTSFFNLDFTLVDSEPRIGEKISNCIPELDLSIVQNTVICGKCADTINSFYIYKEECLRLEMQIREYIQQVQHTGNAIDLAAVLQFNQLHSKNLTPGLKTEAFEKTENYKNAESPTSFCDNYGFNEAEGSTEIVMGNIKNEESTTSFCDNYAFNEAERYTEVVKGEYLTSLAKIEYIENFIKSGKSEAEDNSDTQDNSNIVQDSSLQVVKNPDSCTQNLNKTDIYYQCFTCGHKSGSKLKLIRHLKNHRDTKLHENKVPPKSYKSLHCGYRCNLCNYTTKHKYLFSFHNGAHLTKRDYRHIFKSRPILIVKPSTNTITFSKKNEDSKIKCGSCISNKHKLTHTGEKCSVCEYSCNHKQDLKRHMLTHTDEKPLKCSFCECSFNTKYNLKIHIQTHTGEKPFKCLVCEYSCNQRQSLKIHIRTHTGEKPFKCSVCEYSFNQRSHLKRHMLTHTGEKPFKCSICEYSSNTKYNLNIHIQMHTGEKPFKCSVCEYSCNQKQNLKSHMLTHTGEKLFKCSVCEYGCNHKQSLKSHMLTHTGEKPFKCSICEYS